MARLARCEIFEPREVAAAHVMNRVCRRCHLLGNDPVSGKIFDHRKIWIENELKRLAALMGIDLLGTRRDEEIARRWCRLWPAKKCSDRSS